MLPTLTGRLGRTILPSTGKEVRFRLMQGREEKILLMAKEQGTDEEILTTVQQIVSNCVQGIEDPSSLPIFDTEWLFIRIRLESISNITNVAYIDRSDGRPYQFSIDLEEVRLEGSTDQPGSIDLGGGVRIQLRWPTALDYVAPEVINSETEAGTAHALAARCIDRIYDGDTMTRASDHTAGELDEFIQQFDVDSYGKLMRFVGSVPSLRHVIEYTNSKGEERRIVLGTLTDFFKFR